MKHTYRGEATVLTWLRTIAKNIAYDHFKRKKILTFAEEKRVLYAAITSLKLKYRLAIVLR